MNNKEPRLVSFILGGMHFEYDEEKNKKNIDNIKKNLNSTKKTNKEILTRVKKLNSQKKTLQ